MWNKFAVKETPGHQNNTYTTTNHTKKAIESCSESDQILPDYICRRQTSKWCFQSLKYKVVTAKEVELISPVLMSGLEEAKILQNFQSKPQTHGLKLNLN